MPHYETRKTPGDTSWFVHDRFGMFIHFGLYSMAARHEWIKKNECISEEKYQKYFDHFNPDRFDAKEWARYAKNAGMKYAVLTTKHHEGFCLFDSKYTDYKVTNTPYGKDIVREFVDAFRAEGIRIGFYYSLIDWHHEDFNIDCFHPRRNDLDAEELDKGRDMKKYAEYMRNQVTELLTEYGKIDIMWFDFTYDQPGADYTGDVKPWMKNDGIKRKEDWEAEKLIATVRGINPDIIINNRTGIEQDLWTPEQYQPYEWITHPETGEKVVWEACHTFSGAWGYHRDEFTWKSTELLVNILINTVAAGGNVIMNVGPTPRGRFDQRAIKALEGYAKWMDDNSRSIYGCTKADEEFVPLRGTRLTQSADGKRLYIHLLEYPLNCVKMNMPPDRVDYAQFLYDGSEVKFNYEKENLVAFGIPVVKPDVPTPVIEVFLKQ